MLVNPYMDHIHCNKYRLNSFSELEKTRKTIIDCYGQSSSNFIQGKHRVNNIRIPNVLAIQIILSLIPMNNSREESNNTNWIHWNAFTKCSSYSTNIQM